MRQNALFDYMLFPDNFQIKLIAVKRSDKDLDIRARLGYNPQKFFRCQTYGWRSGKIPLQKFAWFLAPDL